MSPYANLLEDRFIVWLVIIFQFAGGLHFHDPIETLAYYMSLVSAGHHEAVECRVVWLQPHLLPGCQLQQGRPLWGQNTRSFQVDTHTHTHTHKQTTKGRRIIPELRLSCQ